MVDRISTDESFLDYCIDKRISQKKFFLSDLERLPASRGLSEAKKRGETGRFFHIESAKKRPNFIQNRKTASFTEALKQRLG